jgi:hypothetical protein
MPTINSYNLSGPFVLPSGAIVGIPGGGLVHYVYQDASGNGIASLSMLPSGLGDSQNLTVAAALAKCRADRGDVIVCLPGHVENLATAAAWTAVAGVTIIGQGVGNDRPTFTWSAAAATLPINVANFRILNCNLLLAGPMVNGTALTVAAPITISAAGCEISDCYIPWGFDVDQIVAIGITTTAAADNLKFNRNFCPCPVAAVPTTTFLRLTGTDNLEIDSAFISGPGSTTTIGPVQMLTTACLNAKITNSIFQNTLAASTIAFTAIAGCTGMVDWCSFGVLAAGNGITTGSGLQVAGSYTAVAAAAGGLTTG